MRSRSLLLFVLAIVITSITLQLKVVSEVRKKRSEASGGEV